MTDEDILKQHFLGSLYCRNRLFPSIDEFSVSSDFRIDMNIVAFCMLAIRILDKGYSKEEIIQYIENLTNAREKNTATQANKFDTTNVLNFPTKNKKSEE